MWGFGHIGLIISADKFYADSGDPILIRFTVINDGDKTEVIEPKEGPIMDILVRRQSGRSTETRHRWSEGREIQPEMKRFALAPGESRTIEMMWIPPNTGYSTSVDLYGEFHDQYGTEDVHIELCVEDGCAEE